MHLNSAVTNRLELTSCALKSLLLSIQPSYEPITMWC